MLLPGQLPRIGDTVSLADWDFEIVEMDNKRIYCVPASVNQTRCDLPRP